MSNASDYNQYGFGLVEGIGNWMRGMGLRAGFFPLEWDHVARPGLIWRIPDRSMPTASVLSRVQGILVREFEHALVLRNGKIVTEFASGVYDIQKSPLRDFIDIIWISMQITQHKWGVGRVLNRENITLGAHGYLMLYVVDPQKFVLNVVAGNQKYSQQDLEDWVFGIVAGVMRTQIASATIKDLMQGQEQFARTCSDRLAPAFDEWGIGFKNLVISQFDVPEEYRKIVSEVTLARYQAEKKVIEAQATADSVIIESEAQAQARNKTESVEIDLMARMRSLGIDPVRLKAIEAFSQYTQLAGVTGGGSNSGNDMLGMMVFMKMLSDPGMSGEARDVLRSQYPDLAAQASQLPPGEPAAAPAANTTSPSAAASTNTSSPAGSAANERDRIQKILDGLDERLAMGELSEKKYDELQARWAEKMAALPPA